MARLTVYAGIASVALLVGIAGCGDDGGRSYDEQRVNTAITEACAMWNLCRHDNFMDYHQNVQCGTTPLEDCYLDACRASYEMLLLDHCYEDTVVIECCDAMLEFYYCLGVEVDCEGYGHAIDRTPPNPCEDEEFEQNQLCHMGTN